MRVLRRARCLDNGRPRIRARKFFLVWHHANLPQVPACGGCSCEKSKLESHVRENMGLGASDAEAGGSSKALRPKRGVHAANNVLRDIKGRRRGKREKARSGSSRCIAAFSATVSGVADEGIAHGGRSQCCPPPQGPVLPVASCS